VFTVFPLNIYIQYNSWLSARRVVHFQLIKGVNLGLNTKGFYPSLYSIARLKSLVASAVYIYRGVNKELHFQNNILDVSFFFWH